MTESNRQKKKKEVEVVSQSQSKGSLKNNREALTTRDQFILKFQKGYAPTQEDFTDLFNAYLNLSDDGVERPANGNGSITLVPKEKNQLQVQASESKKEIINFKNFDCNAVAWSIEIDQNNKLYVSYMNESKNEKTTILSLSRSGIEVMKEMFVKKETNFDKDITVNDVKLKIDD